jgi:hypothetical protein
MSALEAPQGTTRPAERSPEGLIRELRLSLQDARQEVQVMASQALEYEQEKIFARAVIEAFGALHLAERELDELEDLLAAREVPQ